MISSISRVAATSVASAVVPAAAVRGVVRGLAVRRCVTKPLLTSAKLSTHTVRSASMGQPVHRHRLFDRRTPAAAQCARAVSASALQNLLIQVALSDSKLWQEKELLLRWLVSLPASLASQRAFQLMLFSILRDGNERRRPLTS